MVESTSGAVWDLQGYFPEFNSQEMQDFKNKLGADVETIKKKASNLGSLNDKTAGQWEAVILFAEDIVSRLGHLSSYLSCLESADARNEAYSRERSNLVKLSAEYEKFEIDVLYAFKQTDEEFIEKFFAREKLKDIEYPLERIRERTKYTMSREEELLTTDLNIDGLGAWGRLYNKITGKLEFEFIAREGKKEHRPISQWRSLMADADRAVGRAAYEGGNRAWKGIEDVCAAALNAISGARLSLNRHRGIKHILDKALFDAAIRRETLDSMYQAIHDHLDIPREIFRAKARFFNRQRIWFFEREAPLPLKDTSKLTWRQATEIVLNAFKTAYPALAGYFRQFVQNRWVESEPRPGKRPGAFCTRSTLTREQRVFMTFNGTLSDVSTLAHEVGHAWHGHLMRDIRPMAQRYPMTLAETASIFAEHILAEGIYADETVWDTEKLLMLDGDLCGAAVLLLDITTRYEFEKAFYDERLHGEVPVSRLKELMVETQRRIFGDVLMEDGADPLFWASKLHFYITEVTFYNFPYTFGFLLARALIAMFHREGKDFLPKYETFLRRAGSDSVENLAQQSLGIDISTPEFWEGSIKSLEEPLRRYKEKIKSLDVQDN